MSTRKGSIGKSRQFCQKGQAGGSNARTKRTVQSSTSRLARGCAVIDERVPPAARSSWSSPLRHQRVECRALSRIPTQIMPAPARACGFKSIDGVGKCRCKSVHVASTFVHLHTNERGLRQQGTERLEFWANGDWTKAAHSVMIVLYRWRVAVLLLIDVRIGDWPQPNRRRTDEGDIITALYFWRHRTDSIFWPLAVVVSSQGKSKANKHTRGRLNRSSSGFDSVHLPLSSATAHHTRKTTGLLTSISKPNVESRLSTSIQLHRQAQLHPLPRLSIPSHPIHPSPT